MPTNLKLFIPVLGIMAVLLFAGAVYWPALNGIFLLDDFENLKDLSEIDARGLSFYLFGSGAGPGGRPLSLLSFALQYTSWPADPFAFKLINLLLHLGNGALIFYICRLVFSLPGTVIRVGNMFPCLVSALWLLHPMQLSTVLYVVQRMTILSTSFILIGILIYITGRRFYLCRQKSITLILSLTGVYLSMLLAVLSKETGILLVLYLLVLEFTLLPDVRDIGKWRTYTVPALLLPLLMLAYYLFHDINGFLSAYQIRDYTVGQRLLTEANALIDYLKLIFIPVSGAFSLFHDDYPIASGLLTPPRTLISVLILLMMFVVALYYRVRARLISFAILWFFAGHILESSFINLELYFEHRNYLASLGVFMLISRGIMVIPQKIKSGITGSALTAVYLLVVLLVTVLEVNLWNKPLLQAHEWARQHPQSKRAWVHLLNTNLILGEKEQSEVALQKLQQLDKDDIYPLLKSLTIRNCYEQKKLAASERSALKSMAASAKFRGGSVITELEYLSYMRTKGLCEKLEIDYLSDVIDTLINNSGFRVVQGELYDIATDFAVIRQDADAALGYSNIAISIAPRIDRKILKLKILLAKAATTEAGKLLQEIEEQLRTMPKEMLFYREQIQMFDQQLRQNYPSSTKQAEMQRQTN